MPAHIISILVIPRTCFGFGNRPLRVKVQNEDFNERGGAEALQVRLAYPVCVSGADVNHSETLKGGFIGGSIGLTAAALGVYAGAIRFPVIRHLTLPMKAFLVTSGGTFAGIEPLTS